MLLELQKNVLKTLKSILKENKVMTKEELIKFLKENLTIKITTESDWETDELGIALYLGDEQISCDYFSI